MTPIFGIQLPEETCGPWPWYEPRDIQLPQKRDTYGLPSYTVSRVLLKEKKSGFLKPIRHRDEKSFNNKIDKYKSIRNADLPESVRISRLVELVPNESGKTFGLFLTYNDCCHKTLLYAARANKSRELRQTWDKQVNDTVQQLHAAGIVWSDEKPNDVLVDQKNDAWLFDFGGGYTNGLDVQGDVGNYRRRSPGIEDDK